MHKIQIHILQPQTLQTHIQILLRARMVRTPQLSRDEDIFSLYPAGESFFETLSYFVFVAVAVCFWVLFVSYSWPADSNFFLGEGKGREGKVYRHRCVYTQLTKHRRRLSSLPLDRSAMYLIRVRGSWHRC